MASKRYIIPEARMHGPSAAHSGDGSHQAEALAAELALLRRARDIEREVMALRDLLSAGSSGAAHAPQLKEEIVRLLSKVIMFRAGLARE